MHGDQTLYMALSTGRMYEARGPPPLPVRAVQRHALAVPPLPHGVAAAPVAAAIPSAGPPTPAALLLMGGCPSPRLATYRPWSILGVQGEGGKRVAMHAQCD